MQLITKRDSEFQGELKDKGGRHIMVTTERGEGEAEEGVPERQNSQGETAVGKTRNAVWTTLVWDACRTFMQMGQKTGMHMEFRNEGKAKPLYLRGLKIWKDPRWGNHAEEQHLNFWAEKGENFQRGWDRTTWNLLDNHSDVPPGVKAGSLAGGRGH